MEHYKKVMQDIIIPKMGLLKNPKAVIYTPFLFHTQYTPSDDPKEHQDILHAFCSNCGQHGLRVGSHREFLEMGGERWALGNNIVSKLLNERYPNPGIPSVHSFITDGWIIIQLKALCPKCFRQGVEKCSVCNCWVPKHQVLSKKIGSKMEMVCSDECEAVAWDYYKKHNDTQTVLSEADAKKLKSFVAEG